MNYIFRITLMIATLLLVASCADKKDEDSHELELRSFDAWIQEHVISKGINAEKQTENGMYIVWHNKAATGVGAIALGDWMDIDYKGYNLRDDMFVLRDNISAAREGTFSHYTRYAPQFLRYNEYTGMPEGMRYAVKQMSKGDSVTLYMPSSLASTFSSLTLGNGFNGHYESSASSSPIRMELKLHEITIDPQARQEKQVKEFATNDWGLTAKDTIAKNLYIKIKYNTEGKERVKINRDTTVRLEFTGRFLDDFLLDTNIAALGDERGRDTTQYTYPMVADPKGTKLIAAFLKVFESDTLAYDCAFQMVFTSDFGYGNAITSGAAPSVIIDPYTPLIFEVKVFPLHDPEKDKKGK